MLTNAAYSTILLKNLEDAQLMNSTGFFFFLKEFLLCSPGLELVTVCLECWAYCVHHQV